MNISLSNVSLETYLQLLPAASKIIQKAKAHFEEEGTNLQDIVDMRLYEDMATFAFQVFSISHHSLGAINSLKNGESGPPKMPPDLDFEALQNILKEAEQKLLQVSSNEIDKLSDGEVVFKMGDIRWPFTNTDFILSFSLPNFYFHLTTMYDMLRVKGLPIGKMDFVGQMRLSK
tara:strand:- start:4913 stop:5434 length:522 start_codon:yes stop_codon:yes gene_type:complete